MSGPYIFNIIFFLIGGTLVCKLEVKILRIDKPRG